LAGSGIFDVDGPAVDTCLLPPTFMDDLAVLIQATVATALCANVVRATEVFIRAARQFGLEVNMAAGKSEALLQFVGPTSTAAKRLCFTRTDPANPHVAILELSDGTPLRAVQHYKHLGVIANAAKTPAQEIAARVAASTAAYAALSGRVLCSEHIPVATRCHVAAACCRSRLFYAAGSWLALTPAQMVKVNDAYMRPLRRVAGAHRPPQPGQLALSC